MSAAHVQLQPRKNQIAVSDRRCALPKLMAGCAGQVLEQWELPRDLEKIWMIDSKELHVAVDDQGQPVMLGKGAYGAVRSLYQLAMIAMINARQHLYMASLRISASPIPPLSPKPPPPPPPPSLLLPWKFQGSFCCAFSLLPNCMPLAGDCNFISAHFTSLWGCANAPITNADSVNQVDAFPSIFCWPKICLAVWMRRLCLHHAMVQPCAFPSAIPQASAAAEKIYCMWLPAL